jgi:hypothetical protein
MHSGKEETHVPLGEEVVEIGVPYLDWGKLEKCQKLLLLIRSLLEQFLDLHKVQVVRYLYCVMRGSKRAFSLVRLQIGMPKR